MTLIDDLRAELAETLRSRVLVVFGRVVERVEVEVDDGFLRVPPFGFDSERLIAGMHLPPLVESASVASDGAIDFRLDRGAVAVALLEGEPAEAPKTSDPAIAEAVERANSLLQQEKYLLDHDAADRLLLGDSVPDVWWRVLWPLAVRGASPQLAKAFLALTLTGEEISREQRLLQLVVAKALVRVAS